MTRDVLLALSSCIFSGIIGLIIGYFLQNSHYRINEKRFLQKISKLSSDNYHTIKDRISFKLSSKNIFNFLKENGPESKNAISSAKETRLNEFLNSILTDPKTGLIVAIENLAISQNLFFHIINPTHISSKSQEIQGIILNIFEAILDSIKKENLLDRAPFLLAQSSFVINQFVEEVNELNILGLLQNVWIR